MSQASAKQTKKARAIGLSKSRIISHQQCPKRLWLERFRPELREDDAGSVASMAVGDGVGDLARRLFPGGVLIDEDDLSRALELTREVMAEQPRKPVYEATFQHDGVLVRADILLPERNGAYRMIEVKSSTSMKDYHRKDIAVQASVTEAAGVVLRRIELAHIDNEFVYQGDGNYDGLLRCVDMADEIGTLKPQVPEWVRAARQTLSGDEPAVAPGKQCSDPFACPFEGYCSPQDPDAFPVEILPRISAGQVAALHSRGYIDIREIPKGVLTNAIHERVRLSTRTGRRFLDFEATMTFMDELSWPRYFLDFETINPAIPLWAGSRPYQQIPFQWSCHVQGRNGTLGHDAFLASGSDDPRRDFAESLIRTLKQRGPVLVYNAVFEVSRIRELAEHFPDLREALLLLIERVVDLLPVAREHYYHPAMRGSWSIKAVLPTIAPELAYDGLIVADGGMAQQAFIEILHPDTKAKRREELRQGLLTYCERDTFAMVRLAEFFTRGK